MSTENHFFGVVGDPIQHSLSPTIFAYFAKRFQKNVSYKAYHVQPENFYAWVEENIRHGQLDGVNVTLPHKISAAQLSDCKSQTVHLLQAANVLIREGKQISAENTDVWGVKKTLLNHAQSWKQQQAILLGAGGSAAAAATALAQLGIARICVVNRTFAKSAQLIRRLQKQFLETQFVACHWDDPTGLPQQFDVCVNATSMGMQSCDHWTFQPPPANQGALAFDLVYASHTTCLAKQAKHLGCAYVDGLEMLAWQALASWEIWMGSVLDSEDVIKSVLQILRSQQRLRTLQSSLQT